MRGKFQSVTHENFKVKWTTLKIVSDLCICAKAGDSNFMQLYWWNWLISILFSLMSIPCGGGESKMIDNAKWSLA